MRKSLLEQPTAEQATPQTEANDTPKKAAAKADWPYTDPGYNVKPGEENEVHVRCAREQNLGKQGNRTRIELQEVDHILDPQMWLLCRKNWASQGWIFVKMLHVPYELPLGFDEPEIVAE